MSQPGVSRIFLRAAIAQTRLTKVQPRPSTPEAGAVLIGQRLCWAACLAEFEQVEVFNVTRGIRLLCHVRYGTEREVQVAHSAGAPMQPGDEVRISAYAWLPPDEVETHFAIMVIVDESNELIEFRRITPRAICLDPASFPPPPSIEVIVGLAPPLPVDATD